MLPPNKMMAVRIALSARTSATTLARGARHQARRLLSSATVAASADRLAFASQPSSSHPALLPPQQHRGLSTQSLEDYCEEESLSQIFHQHAKKQACGERLQRCGYPSRTPYPTPPSLGSPHRHQHHNSARPFPSVARAVDRPRSRRPPPLNDRVPGRLALKTGDISRVLAAVGDRPSPTGLQHVFEHVDQNGDGLIEEGEFVNSASHLLTCRHWRYDPPPHTQRSRSLSTGEVHRLFGMLDHDGDGYLSVGDLTGVMSTFGGNLSREEAERFVRLADGNGDGLVTISEFFRLLDEPRAAAASYKLRSSFNVVLLIGGPGSGKGVLSDRIASNNDGVVHLSSGDLLRSEVAQKTPLGMECAATMEAGELIKSVTMTRLLKKNCTQHPGHWVLLDGFPRSLKNCQNFEKLCGKPDFAIYIDVPDDVMVARILKRGADSGRADDNLETAHARLRTFHEQGVPTLQYLEGQGIPIYELDGTQSPDDVWRQFQMMNTPLTRSQQTLVGFGSI